MESPFQEVPGTPSLDRVRSLPDSQSPTAVVPTGARGRPERSQRLARTPHSVVSPFVVPSGMSPMTPSQTVEVRQTSVLVRSANRQTPYGTPQGSVLDRPSRRRQTNGTPQEQLKGTPMRQTNLAPPRQLLTSSGTRSKLSEQVVPSTPKQPADHMFTTPKSCTASAKTHKTGKRNENMDLHSENVVIDATGDHQARTKVGQPDNKRATVARQRRLLMPRESGNNQSSSYDILDQIE